MTLLTENLKSPNLKIVFMKSLEFFIHSFTTLSSNKVNNFIRFYKFFHKIQNFFHNLTKNCNFFHIFVDYILKITLTNDFLITFYDFIYEKLRTYFLNFTISVFIQGKI